MRQYSIDKVELTWAGLDFKKGLAAGTAITEAQTSQRWAVKPTGTGSIVRAFNPDKSGTLSVIVDQESLLHQQLKLLLKADELNRNVVFPGRLFDGSSQETMNYKNMFMLTRPDETRGTESATFTWVFGFESIEDQPNVSNANAVGQ